MTTIEKQLELKNKIILGLEQVYIKLLAYKKQKNSTLVVLKDNKVVRIKPESMGNQL